MAKKHSNRLHKVKHQKSQRPTFGQGLGQIIAIFYEGRTEFENLRASLFDKSSFYDKHIASVWQEFKVENPALANRMIELLFLDGSISQKIDDFLDKIDRPNEHLFKSFIYRILKDLRVSDTNDYYSFDRIIKNPQEYSDIELSYFLYKRELITFHNDIEYNDYVKELEQILPLFNASSWEYYETLIVNLFQSSFLLSQDNKMKMAKITGKSIKILWGKRRVLSSGLLEDLAKTTQNYVNRSVIEDLVQKSERERLQYVINLLDPSNKKKAPNLLFFNDIPELCEYNLEPYLLSIIESLIPKEITEWQLYTNIIELLLASAIFDIKRLKEDDETISAYEQLYYREEKFKANISFSIHFLERVLKTLYQVEDSTKDIQKEVYDKIYQFFLYYEKGEEVEKACPPSIKSIVKLLITLQVDLDSSEMTISHYTTAESAEKMLLTEKRSNLRLFSIYSLNDPYEGKLLDKYFGEKEEPLNLKIYENSWLNFVACFTFERNNFNQFRLYGKSSFHGVEAGGIAMEMHKRFFSNNIASSSQYEKIKSGYPLYRCVYVNKHNPDKVTLIAGNERNEIKALKDKIDEIKKAGDQSLGNDKIKVLEDKINAIKIKKNTESLKTKVEKELKILKDIMINRNSNTIEPLEQFFLEQLSHLIKNDDYKEENECRIFDMINPKNEKIQGINQAVNLYIEDTRDFRRYIEKIIIGENFSKPELFLFKIKQVYKNNQPSKEEHPPFPLKIEYKNKTIDRINLY